MNRARQLKELVDLFPTFASTRRAESCRYLARKKMRATRWQKKLQEGDFFQFFLLSFFDNTVKISGKKSQHEKLWNIVNRMKNFVTKVDFRVQIDKHWLLGGLWINSVTHG